MKSMKENTVHLSILWPASGPLSSVAQLNLDAVNCQAIQYGSLLPAWSVAGTHLV